MSMTPYRASAALDEQLRRERMAQEAWLRALERGAVPAAREAWIERWTARLPVRGREFGATPQPRAKAPGTAELTGENGVVGAAGKRAKLGRRKALKSRACYAILVSASSTRIATGGRDIAGTSGAGPFAGPTRKARKGA